MSKGQMEIMGLIVIVILLTLGMFFIVAFKSNQPKEDKKKEYSENQLASNFILTYISTSSGCKNYSIENMIQQCALENKTYCDGMPPCEFVNKTAKIFLEETLDKWNLKYRFTSDDLKLNFRFEKNCSEEAEQDLLVHPVPIWRHGYSGNIPITMAICD